MKDPYVFDFIPFREDMLERDIEQALSQKEINRLKLAAARKRDAEKYGETYAEVTDDDLKS